MNVFEVAVLRRGRESVAALAYASPTLRDVTQSDWFQQGLPPGALGMADTFTARSESWRASHRFAALREKLQGILHRAEPGTACAAEACHNAAVLAGHIARLEVSDAGLPAVQHSDGRDDASAAELSRRDQEGQTSSTTPDPCGCQPQHP